MLLYRTCNITELSRLLEKNFIISYKNYTNLTFKSDRNFGDIDIIFDEKQIKKINQFLKISLEQKIFKDYFDITSKLKSFNKPKNIEEDWDNFMEMFQRKDVIYAPKIFKINPSQIKEILCPKIYQKKLKKYEKKYKITWF